MSTGRCGLQTLAVEVQHCILTSLSDLRSLVAAALTCRSFYSIFKDNEDNLVREVLINCVGLGALPEAIITHRCSPPYLSVHVNLPTSISEDTQTDQLHNYVAEFLQQLERPSLSSITLTMRDAITISDLHVQVVSVFTQRFIQACIKGASSLFPLEDSLQSRRASRSEEERIARTLYRFEIFRKLLGCFCDREDELLQYAAIFFSKFAPWENAQLGCIHDFLVREISPAFYDVAEHDIVWGEHSTVYKADLNLPTLQHILTLGLERILEIASSESYAERESLLKVREMPPGENSEFLQCSLESISTLDMLQGAGKDILEALPFCADGDSGAELLWTLSMAGDSQMVFAVYEDSDWPYRRWGYILWDYGRLQTLGALVTPWMRTEGREYLLSTALTEMEASWRARAALYRRGGRGYWSIDDETRVVWPERSSKQRSRSDRIIPQSLTDAKKFWQTGLD